MGEDFSNRFRRARMAAGLKAKDLALLLGVSASYISMIEAGKKTNVNEKILTAAAEIMRVSVNFLLKGVDAHAQVRETPAAKMETIIAPSVTNISPPPSTSCRYPERCDLESELGEVKERLAAMEHQLGTVIRLLGASLHLSDAAADPGRPARKVG
jgi:transcriptional regulator with XRE-family HTH domain